MFGGREGAGPYTYVIGAIFGLSTLGMLVTNWSGASGPRKAELLAARRDYLRYLAGQRTRVRKVITDQRDALRHRHPEPRGPVGLRGRARGSGSAGPTDGDFGVVRVGVGDPVAGDAAGGAGHRPDDGPGAGDRRARCAGSSTGTRSCPTCPSPSRCARSPGSASSTAGDGAAAARALARAVLAQLATFHAPDDLVVAALVAPERRREWDWLKWLPHALHPTAVDALGPRRLVATTAGRARRAARGARGQAAPVPAVDARPIARRETVASPHVVVVVDGVDGRRQRPPRGRGRPGRRHRARCRARRRPARPVDHPPEHRRRRRPAQLHSGRAGRTSAGPTGSASSRPRAWPGGWPRCACRPAVRDQAPLATDRNLTELLGDPGRRHGRPRPRCGRRGRPATCSGSRSGPARTATPVELDLKEAAQDGMGPHGLIVGATGSGKSELLRTLVLGLALTHSSEQLNFVLVDFKGGATFASLDAPAPHLGRDHEPGRRAAAGRPHARRDERRAHPPAGAAAPRRATSPRCATTTGPGRPGPTCRRCPRCCSSATSSPSCSPPSPTSSTCSSRSDGSAARSACTCCSPPSGWRRAGCAGWRPTCRTGSPCGRSPRTSRG